MSDEQPHKLNLEKLRQYSLFIGTPMYGGQCTGMYTKSTNELAMICAKNGIHVQFYYLFNESLVQRARNYITDEFMRSECTHLMFIDADIGFEAKDVLTLLGLQISDPSRCDIITGPYPKKTIAWEKVAAAAEQGAALENPFNLSKFTSDYVFNPIAGTKSFNMKKPVEVAEAGTGFMLIPRTALNTYKDAYPEQSYRPDHARSAKFDGSTDITAYFDCVIDPETRRYLSEDYYFCKQSRKSGLSLWLCPWMKLDHVGSYVFKGDLSAIAALKNVSATADKTSNEKNYTGNENKG
jgi:hypothetical protein